MKKSEWQKLWDSGVDVSISFDAPMPAVNFASFPEDVTAALTEGTYFGLHFADDIQAFNAEFELCMYDHTVVDMDRIQRYKDSHGATTVYAVIMRPNGRFPVLEIDNGAEYRSIPGPCAWIRKINL